MFKALQNRVDDAKTQLAAAGSNLDALTMVGQEVGLLAVATDLDDRFNIKCLILLMALVGLSPLGQTSTQFIMVWHRNRR